MNIFRTIKFFFKNKARKKRLIKNQALKNENKVSTQKILNLINAGDLENAKLGLSQIQNSLPQEDTLYKLSKFFSNFSDNTRLKIISCLAFGELCVTDIAKALNMNQTTISHQLAYLKSCGTVTSRREGKIIFYSLTTSKVQECLNYGANFITD